MSISDNFNATHVTAITEREMTKARMACLDYLAENSFPFQITPENLLPLAEQMFAFIKGDVKPTTATAGVAMMTGNVTMAKELLAMAASDTYENHQAIIEKATALKAFIFPPPARKEASPDQVVTLAEDHSGQTHTLAENLPSLS